MPATKTPAKRTTKSTGSAATQKRNEKALAALDISLEKTQAALAAMRTDLGRDGKRIARDIEKLVSTARRDVQKLSHAVRTDIERTSRSARPRRAAAKPASRTRAHA